ncbi:hypothetical protein REPUB_Repub19eG0051900 [Reevesia pubescens]
MEVATLFNITLSFFIILFALVSKSIIQKRKSPRNLPPSPPALPILGHLHLLKEPVHGTLHDLSEKYGPIMNLQFGTRKVLVVSSASAAEECFTKNDILCASHLQLLAGKHLNYNYATMGFAPYGDYWRNLRRLTTSGLLSTSRLATFASIRQEEVQLLLKELFEASSRKSDKRYYGKDAVDKEATEFRDIMREFSAKVGSTSLNDFLPVLQWIDFQGVQKRMKGLVKKLDKFLQSLLEEHKKMREDSTDGSFSASDASKKGRKTTFIDVMLSLQQTEPKFYTDETIKGVILAMLIAGTETSSTTIEWAMALLLIHPE